MRFSLRRLIAAMLVCSAALAWANPGEYPFPALMLSTSSFGIVMLAKGPDWYRVFAPAIGAILGTVLLGDTLAYTFFAHTGPGADYIPKGDFWGGIIGCLLAICVTRGVTYAQSRRNRRRGMGRVGSPDAVTTLALEGLLEPEPATEGPFFDANASGPMPADGRPGMRIVRRSGV